jgi:tripartite-type tricarboxylate transporter receptor subunit TctC
MVRYRFAFLMCSVAAALAAPCAPLPAQEEKYPLRPIQVVLSFPPGGALDVAVRLLETRLSAVLGVPLVIMSRPGAGGSIAVNSVIKAPPDGYTVLATFNTAINLVRVTNKEVTYTYKDLIAVGNIAIDVGAIVVERDARWRSFEALLDEGKQNPGKLNYGSAGIGSVSALMLDAIKLQRGVDMVHVPFAGTPPAIIAVLGKQVDFGTIALSPAISFVKDGKMRALAVSSTQRLSAFPDVPALEELGIRNASLSLKAGLYLPLGTPPRIVDTLAKAFSVAMQDPAIGPLLEKAGLFPRYEDAATAQAAIAKEYDEVMELGRALKLVQ